jgi:uncharacterized sulfatase
MIARLPGRIPSGEMNSALQSNIDYAPTFLSAAGIGVPSAMQGLDQWPCWLGDRDSIRDHVIVENRHEPTRVHARTYVDELYKMTVYRDRDEGELFDLAEDPGEIRNLWDDPDARDLKLELYRRFLNAELRREPTRMPRIAGA